MAAHLKCLRFNPNNWVQVSDAETEIFTLYTSRKADEFGSGGLGFVDPTAPVLEITMPSGMRTPKRTRRRAKSTMMEVVETRSITIRQDPLLLRRESGNTGAVVWRTSLSVARVLLSGNAFMSSNSTVLELGSGTGVLPLCAAHLFTEWIATDLRTSLPLIRENVSTISNVKVRTLDWFEPLDFDLECFPDWIIAVDCIYNPHLLPGLLNTLNTKASSETAVLIAAELRQVETVRLWLELWLRDGDWQIWRYIPTNFDDPLENKVMWVGWKVTA